ncbi:hypothetical protein [Rahnella victoriana]|jgi:hypothetical protein|nr:hypothetical protein [Rahnella victoriana]
MANNSQTFQAHYQVIHAVIGDSHLRVATTWGAFLEQFVPAFETH